MSKDFTFSDGLKVPKGAFLSCAASAMHNDAEIYENPDVFSPFRFSDVRGHGHGEETKHQFVATGVSSLSTVYNDLLTTSTCINDINRPISLHLAMVATLGVSSVRPYEHRGESLTV